MESFGGKLTWRMGLQRSEAVKCGVTKAAQRRWKGALEVVVRVLVCIINTTVVRER